MCIDIEVNIKIKEISLIGQFPLALSSAFGSLSRSLSQYSCSSHLLSPLWRCSRIEGILILFTLLRLPRSLLAYSLDIILFFRSALREAAHDVSDSLF